VAAGAGDGGFWVLPRPDPGIAQRGGDDVVGGAAVGFWAGKWWRNQWLGRLGRSPRFQSSHLGPS